MQELFGRHFRRDAREFSMYPVSRWHVLPRDGTGQFELLSALSAGTIFHKHRRDV